ncbi:PREDICTED: upstream stimulatory factor [Drosophila arizonae]|uniref:Upstream stimulatory factor n=1 Tax=Drosophila arizonae TaxID=7263 RepID=A0ABM1PSX4_DROAR|nr:PREDICTED: upstream stimulatory factor [Drosophila arizonae]
MNVKKRPRLELATAATPTAATDVAYATYSNGNGAGTATNGIFLASGVDVNNGAQIYLTICGDDDNSNESQEFYAIESIKQEPDLDALHALLPTNLQLPTGCEIYLVKDTTTTTTTSPKAHEQLLQKQHQHQHQQQNQHQQQHAQPLASIKLEPDSIATPSTNVLYVSGSGATTTTHNIVVAASKDSPGSACGSGSGSSSSSLPVASHAAAAAVPAIASAGYNVKMDAFKKRDDKRRATHNEVERRRRDKINCWIFKLKEMLPTEGNRYKPMAETLDSKAASMRNNQQQQQNGRTPPNDSKSQILIKACDYIKSMQNEIDSLRDCLQEAEHLRLSNQALRDELETLKQQQELQERFNTAGGSFNVTLNSLNSSATSDLFDNMDGAANLSAVSSINFTKRGLMISDYDE